MIKSKIPLARELAKEIHSMNSILSVANGMAYIDIIARGEQLFYHHNGRSLICDLFIPIHSIAEKTINRWDNGKLLTNDELTQVKADLVNYFAQRGEFDLKFV